MHLGLPVGFTFVKGGQFLGLIPLGDSILPVSEHFGGAGTLFECFAARPGFDTRATPGGVDQTDRHLQHLMQVTAKKVTHRGELSHIGAGGLFPHAFAVGLWRHAWTAFDIEHADLRMIGGGDFLLSLAGLLHRQLHVRLPGADPHFADEDVLEGNRVFSSHHEISGLGAGIHRVQRDRPFAGRVGERAVRLIAEGHLHVFAGISGAPDADELRLLQHHAIGENGGQFDLGLQAGGQQEDAGNGVFHGGLSYAGRVRASKPNVRAGCCHRCVPGGRSSS